MARNPFCLAFERLPETLPVFPLDNAVVMPGCQLPLNFFEPRYLNMVSDALASYRMIGMVQPRPNDGSDPDSISVYSVGTAGRIMSFTETDDGRLLVVLTGVCRFDLVEEIATTRGYRRFKVGWQRWAGDYEYGTDRLQSDSRLVLLLRTYLQQNQIETDWKALEQMPLTVAVNILVGQLPFSAGERQSLIEMVTLDERINKLLELVEWKLMEGSDNSDQLH